MSKELYVGKVKSPDEVWISVAGNIVTAENLMAPSAATNFADKITKDYMERFPNHSHNETSSKYTCRWRPIVDFDGHTEYSHVAIKNKSTGAITYGKIYYHDYHDEYFFVLYKDYQKYTYKKVSEMITDSDISWYYLDYDVPPLEV